MTAPLHDDGAAEPQDGAPPGGARSPSCRRRSAAERRRPVAVVAVAVVAVVGLAVVGGQLGHLCRPTAPAEVEASVARIIPATPTPPP